MLYVPSQQVLAVHRHALKHTWSTHTPLYIDPSDPSDPFLLPHGPHTLLHTIFQACLDNQSLLILDSHDPHASKCGITACGWLLGYPVVYAWADNDLLTLQTLDPYQDTTKTAWDTDVWDHVPTTATHLTLYLVHAHLSCAPLPGLSLPYVTRTSLTCRHRYLAFSLPAAMPDAQKHGTQFSERLQTHAQRNSALLPSFLQPVTLSTHCELVHRDRIAL